MDMSCWTSSFVVFLSIWNVKQFKKIAIFHQELPDLFIVLVIEISNSVCLCEKIKLITTFWVWCLVLINFSSPPFFFGTNRIVFDGPWSLIWIDFDLPDIHQPVVLINRGLQRGPSRLNGGIVFRHSVVGLSSQGYVHHKHWRDDWIFEALSNGGVCTMGCVVPAALLICRSCPCAWFYPDLAPRSTVDA